MSELFIALWDVWKEMFSASMHILPKVLSIFLWILAALFILPCVMVANLVYPIWVEWGEDI